MAGVAHVLAAAERGGDLAAARPEVVLVDDEQRRAVLLGQRCHGTPAMADHAVVAANGVARPHVRRQRSSSAADCGLRRDAAVVDLFGVPRPGRVRVHIRSGALTPRIARPLAMTWRVAWHSASRAVCSSLGCLVALRQHPAGVVEPVVVAGQVFEVAADPVRFAQGRSGFQHPRELAEAADQRALFVVGEQLEVAGVGGSARVRRRCGPARTAGHARIARSRPGFRWTRLTTAPGRCRSGCRPSERISAYRAASTPIASTRSSRVMTVPARLLIRTGWPSRTRLTICPISTSTVSGSSPSAAAAALSRAM